MLCVLIRPRQKISIKTVVWWKIVPSAKWNVSQSVCFLKKMSIFHQKTERVKIKIIKFWNAAIEPPGSFIWVPHAPILFYELGSPARFNFPWRTEAMTLQDASLHQTERDCGVTRKVFSNQGAQLPEEREASGPWSSTFIRHHNGISELKYFGFQFFNKTKCFQWGKNKTKNHTPCTHHHHFLPPASVNVWRCNETKLSLNE